MDLNYSEEQLILKDSADRFLSENYKFERHQRIVAGPEGFSREIWAQFAALGWLALPLPESGGGLGFGAVELSLLMECFGKSLVVEPYLSTVVLGAGLLAALGREELLPGVAEGKLLLAAALGKGVTAAPAGAGWRLEGRQIAVLGAEAADYLIVAADAGVFLLPKGTGGVTLSAYRTPNGFCAADLSLAGMTLGPDALLGDSAVVEGVTDRAIAALCADAVGALSVLVDATVDYARTRHQFGKPIGSFQALQHRMAEMAVLREEARGLALLAALKVEAPPLERARAVSAAKVKVGRAGRFIAHQAVQIHGAMGVTDELNIGAYLKRLLVLELLLGPVDFHLRRYARLARHPGLMAEGLLAS